MKPSALDTLPAARWATWSVIVLAGASLLAGCASGSRSGPRAVALIKPASGSQVMGDATFTQRRDNVVMTARVSGLKPNREHGFHVHEKGDCSSPDAESAGKHFDPSGQPHGKPARNMSHHLGDIPVLQADASGTATLRYEFKDSTVLGKGATDLMGKALVVHADPDDYTTQPSGNSGKRIGCGVIALPVTPGGVGSGSAQTIPKQM